MDEDKPFTVRDRRKFTAEGDLKNDAVEVPAPAPPSEPADSPARGPEAPAADPAPRSERADVAHGEGKVDFAGFLVSLATQASVLLSTSEGDVRENLRGAQHLIGVLEMLEDKTSGRRTAEEQQLLEQLLYELRMAYVQRSRTVEA